MDEEVKFKCSCGKEYSVEWGSFMGYLNWECPVCSKVNPPINYSGYTIKGCENTKH